MDHGPYSTIIYVLRKADVPDTFRGKLVYCNCDDLFKSNFFKYFAANFNKLGLEKLITTSYDGSPIAGQGTLFPRYSEGNGKRQKPKALAVILDHVKDEDGDGAVNIDCKIPRQGDSVNGELPTS